MAAAVAVDAVFQDVDRQELRLADFTMGGTLGVDIQRAAADEFQSRIKLLGEIVRTAASKASV